MSTKKTEEKKKRTNENSVVVVGTLAETGNLAVFKEDGDEVIKGKDFKKPDFVIESNGYSIGVRAFPTSKDKKPERFEALKKVMTYEVGTRVEVKGMISVGNPRLSANGNVYESVDITAWAISSSNVPEEDMAAGKVSGYIKGLKEEMDNEGEETGRGILDFWMYNEYNGDESLKPFPVVVPKKLMEDAMEYFDDEGNGYIEFNVTSQHKGGKKKKETEGGFGSRNKNIQTTSGYNVTEFEISYGTFFDEDNAEFENYYIDEDKVKKLFRAHKQKVEEARNGENKSSDNSSKKGLGKKNTHIEEVDEDDDENPFDD